MVAKVQKWTKSVEEISGPMLPNLLNPGTDEGERNDDTRATRAHGHGVARCRRLTFAWPASSGTVIS
jgi:hypothetical protein